MSTADSCRLLAPHVKTRGDHRHFALIAQDVAMADHLVDILIPLTASGQDEHSGLER